MSRLAELIEELCPDGVEYKPIGSFAQCVAGATPNSKDPSLWDGNIPWMSSGEVNKRIIRSTDRCITQRGFDSCSTKMIPAGAVVVALAGQGKTRGTVARTRIELCTNQSLCAIISDANVDSDFLFHYLVSQYNNLRAVSSGDGTRGGLNLKMIREYRVPVPPVEIQREIVRILDQFTTLEAELEAELEARRAQYEHYRNHLLSYDSLAARGPVEMVKLGAVSRISAGYGFPKSEQGHLSGEYPFYKVSDMNRPGNQVFLEGAANYLSEPDIRRLKIVPFPAGAIVFPKIGAAIATNKKRILSCPSLVDNNVAVCIPEGVDGKYLYYWFLEHDLRVVAHDSGAVPSIRKTDLEQLDVPVPSVAEQERIVEVLDRFNALVNDITSGLPAEIAARRAQYEHYRDRLLSFPEKAVSVSDAS